MAKTVLLSKPGRKISMIGLRPPFFAAAFQRSDSGTKKTINSASTAGLAPTNIIHRQSSTVTRPRERHQRNEQETEIGRCADNAGQFQRCRSGQHSMTSATASDHSPPMPSAARKRNKASCPGAVAK